jgi:hypothetical protein
LPQVASCRGPWHGGNDRASTREGPSWVKTRKPHVEHNESAPTLIADIPGTWISAAMGQQRSWLASRVGYPPTVAVQSTADIA